MSNFLIDFLGGGGSGGGGAYPLSAAGWWKLDESSGTVATDSSGNGRNGTYGVGAVHAAAISANSAGCLDNTGGAGYVTIPLTSALNVGQAPPWAIAITLKIDALGAGGVGGSGQKHVFVNYGSEPFGYFDFALIVDPTDGLYGSFTKLNTTSISATTPGSIGTTAQRAVLNHTGTALELWINRTLIQSVPTTAVAWNGGADGIVIGRGFDGRTSDAMVFDDALNSSQITADAVYFGF